jgi:hypothetical protein
MAVFWEPSVPPVANSGAAEPLSSPLIPEDPSEQNLS